MNRFSFVYLGAVALLGASLMLACSGETEQDASNDGSTTSAASTAVTGGGSPTTSSTTRLATTTGSQSTGSSGGGSGNGSGGTTGTIGNTTTAAGGAGNATGAGGAAGSSTDGGPDCNTIECLRPYECVEYCGGPILASGCCPCADGQIDSFIECRNVCTDGETMDDGCNTCSCSGGTWACTNRACPDTFCGAMAGDTCAPDEYCAYMEGEYCGAADAQATCQPRPDVCIAVEDPVCGCDGKTYGNSCEAARAGTGVNTAGPCPSP